MPGRTAQMPLTLDVKLGRLCRLNKHLLMPCEAYRSSFRSADFARILDNSNRRQTARFLAFVKAPNLLSISAMPYPPACVCAGLSRGLCFGLTVAVALTTPIAGVARGSRARRTATVKLVQQARPSIVNIHGQKTLAGRRRLSPR